MTRTALNMTHYRMNFWSGLALALQLCIGVAVGSASVAGTSELPLVRFDVSRGTSFSVAAAGETGPIVFDLQGQIWTVPYTGGRATSVTDPMWEVRHPTWSPDGSWLAVQRYTDQNWHIFILRPDGSSLRQLTFGPSDNVEPTWSRDGARILFVSDRDTGFDLWSVEVGSGKLERIAAAPGDEDYPAMAPDSSSIAFVRQHDGVFSLVLRKIATGVERILVSGRADLFGPTFSPDGKALAYVEVSSAATKVSATRLVSLELETGKTDVLSPPESDAFPGRPTWLANGDLIYAADGVIRRRSQRSGKTSTIAFKAELAVAHVPSYPRRDYRFDAQGPQSVRGILRPAVSPDGRRIAFTALGNLWLREDKAEPRRLTHDPYLDVDPAWSPDGHSLAYVSDHDGSGKMALYLRDPDGGQDRKLAQGDDDLMMPAWSPDGTTIAVLMRDSRNWHATTLLFVDVATGKLRKLPQSGSPWPWFLPSAPTWSPDGKTIAMSALMKASERDEKGLNEVMLVSTETGATRFVSPVKDVSLYSRSKHGPIWSPDGRYLAYVQDSLLWMIGIHPDGTLDGPPIRLTTEAADSPSWTGDSRSIVYLSFGHLRRVDIEDGSTMEIALNLQWQRAAAPASQVVHVGRLYDGVHPKYRENVDIVLEGNRIRDIVPHRTSWPGSQVIDLSKYTVVPGLFQMHVHHFLSDGERDGRNWLAFGITSVREPGSDAYEALERRESWAAGNRTGPRLFYAGILEGSRLFYWMNIPISSPAAVEIELQRAVALDYDFLKTYERMDERIMKRVVEFSHEHGLYVASHKIYPAALYGADAVEHLGAEDRMPYSDRESLSNRVYDDALEIMSHSGISIVPTRAGRSPGENFLYEINQLPKMFEFEQFRAWPQRWLKAAQGTYKWEQGAYGDRLGLVPNTREALRDIGERGIRIGTGTDGGTDSHGYSVILEIISLARSGLGTHAALQAATLHAAEAIGAGKDLGSLEVGKLADLVAVDGDPLRDLADLYRVRSVMKDGRLFSMEELLRAP